MQWWEQWCLCQEDTKPGCWSDRRAVDPIGKFSSPWWALPPLQPAPILPLEFEQVWFWGRSSTCTNPTRQSLAEVKGATSNKQFLRVLWSSLSDSAPPTGQNPNSVVTTTALSATSKPSSSLSRAWLALYSSAPQNCTWPPHVPFHALVHAGHLPPPVCILTVVL